MAITTLTLNGVEIQTTTDLAEILTALQPKAAVADTVAALQPVTDAVVAEGNERKAAAAKQRKVRAAKPTAARQTKSDGKALWASITQAVAEGNYAEARRLAEPKPDTFGVQAEAAIERHMKRAAKQPTTTTAKPKARPMSESPVLDKVQPEPTKAERRAAKQQKAAQAAKRPNHKPDCGCVTCPKGIEQRKAAAQPKAEKVEPKVTTLPEGKRTRKARAANQPKAEVAQEAPTAPKEPQSVVKPAEAEAVLKDGDAKITALMEAMDIDGLAKASGAYLQQMKRQERLNRQELAVAYDRLVDAADTAITVIKEQQAAEATA